MQDPAAEVLCRWGCVPVPKRNHGIRRQPVEITKTVARLRLWLEVGHKDAGVEEEALWYAYMKRAVV